MIPRIDTLHYLASTTGGLGVPQQIVEKRHLQQVELYEVSLTVLPMNPQAQVIRVKSQLRSVRDYETWLRQTGGFSKSEAKRLAAHGWDGGGDDDEEDEDKILLWLRPAAVVFGQQRNATWRRSTPDRVQRSVSTSR
jgi:hypothetical protein